MSRPRYKRAAGEHAAEEPEVPIVLPHVVMQVAGDGTMTVTVDGAPHLPEPFAPPWRRDSFAAVLDRLTDQRRSPVRVEVREADGTVFTDIITPSRRRAVPEPPGRPAAPAPLPVLYGDGFVPGEDVAIAVVIAHGDAAPDGTMRGLIEAAQLAASPTREVILLGRVSGAVTIGHPE
ncbi:MULTISPECIES: hypothetical protein [Micrococcales]|jgi:hypothetical protein|uniref:hypothetical protein n=1 Tax=Micrococcales TaxID=85006 RepID=UPI0007B23E35|nr:MULTISPECIES: hypothetical protein [Microbacteriaceae]KZE90258.1 hypothetical protein AVP41_01672 [Microbacterium sp. TNHR37B]